MSLNQSFTTGSPLPARKPAVSDAASGNYNLASGTAKTFYFRRRRPGTNTDIASTIEITANTPKGVKVVKNSATATDILVAWNREAAETSASDFVWSDILFNKGDEVAPPGPVWCVTLLSISADLTFSGSADPEDFVVVGWD